MPTTIALVGCTVLALAGLSAATTPGAALFQGAVDIRGPVDPSKPFGYAPRIVLMEILSSDADSDLCDASGMIVDDCTDTELDCYRQYMHIDGETTQGEERWTGVELCPTTDLMLHLADFRVDYVIVLVHRDPQGVARSETVTLISSEHMVDGIVQGTGCKIQIVSAGASAFAFQETTDSLVYQCGDEGSGLTVKIDGTPSQPLLSYGGNSIVISAYATGGTMPLFDVMARIGITITDGPAMRAFEQCGAACGMTAATSSASAVGDAMPGIIMLLAGLAMT